MKISFLRINKLYIVWVKENVFIKLQIRHSNWQRYHKYINLFLKPQSVMKSFNKSNDWDPLIYRKTKIFKSFLPPGRQYIIDDFAHNSFPNLGCQKHVSSEGVWKSLPRTVCRLFKPIHFISIVRKKSKLTIAYSFVDRTKAVSMSTLARSTPWTSRTTRGLKCSKISISKRSTFDFLRRNWSMLWFAHPVVGLQFFYRCNDPFEI